MNRVDRLRIGIIATLGVIVGGVAIYSLLYAMNWLPDFDSDSTDYTILDRPLETDPIEVVEFFSYACPFCELLEEKLPSWEADLPEGVELRHIHVAYDTLTNRLAKAHLVLQSQNLLEDNHQRIFTAIHDQNKTFLSDDRVADVLEAGGIDRERFLTSMNSRQINRRIEVNREFVAEVQAPGVPSMLVANRYVVANRGGSTEMLDTVDWLIEEILAGRAPVAGADEDVEEPATPAASMSEIDDSMVSEEVEPDSTKELPIEESPADEDTESDSESE